jgi:hypothetical protein
MPRKHRVREALKAVIAAEKSGHVYDPPRVATVSVLDPKTGETKVYQMQVDGEANGAWAMSHKRPSGKWDRKHRARHVGVADAKNEPINLP